MSIFYFNSVLAAFAAAHFLINFLERSLASSIENNFSVLLIVNLFMFPKIVLKNNNVAPYGALNSLFLLVLPYCHSYGAFLKVQ